MRRPPIYGLMAEFDDVQQLIEAARRTREAGYRDYDAYTPIPVEELAEVMHAHDTRLPWLVLAGFLVHAVWLGSTYQSMREGGFSFRTTEALGHRLWIIWLSDLLYATIRLGVPPWAGRQTLGRAGSPLRRADDALHHRAERTQ